MTELVAATEIALAAIDGTEIVPVREAAAPGLLRLSLSRLKAWLFGASWTSPPADGAVLVWLTDQFVPGVAGAAGGGTYYIPVQVIAAATASEVLLVHVFGEAISFAGNFAGSVSFIGTNPAATFTLDLAKNGAACGTITVTSAGVVTFASTGGTAVSFVAGDRLQVTAQAGVDTLALASFTLKGAKA